MNRVEKTTDLFMNGGLNCAQAILTVYGETLGVDPDTAKVFGRPLGGGVGTMGQICGFLTGGALVLAHAFNHQDERQARKETHPKVVEFLMAFKERCGTVTCVDLLGADMGTEEGRKKIKEEELVRKRCPAYGKNAAEILEALL